MIDERIGAFGRTRIFKRKPKYLERYCANATSSTTSGT
jgi:hypothetical protein